MENYNLLHRIGKIFGLITSSTFFITLFVIIVLTVALVIINSKVKIKLPKILAGVGYLIIVVFVFIKYGSAFNGLQDTFTNKAFSSFYFPNLITYISIVLISIFVIILNFLSKTKTIVFKVISIISFGTIMSLFVIILDIVIKKEIDINSAKSIYENTDLMILIQASTFVFFIWMVIELIDYFSKKLTERSSSDKTNVSPNNYNKVSGRIGEIEIVIILMIITIIKIIITEAIIIEIIIMEAIIIIRTIIMVDITIIAMDIITIIIILPIINM